MKPFVFVFCEGNDTKFVVCYKENSKLKLLKAASVEVLKEKVSASTSSMDTFNLMQTDTDINIDLNTENNQLQPSGQIFESIVASELSGIKLNKCPFVPILTEPSTYFQIQQEKGSAGITEISETKTLTKTKEIKKSEKKKQKKNEQEITLSDGSKLKVFLSSDIPCFTMLNNLARYYHKRYFKIVSVKNAEISLSHYVAKRKKFFPDDYSLIVYIGKEYSKLIFLHGRKLRHIGSTIDIGTSNLNTYDVYFSKILLEMENGNIPILDNIVICGEDVSENIILSLYGSFPEANVSRLEFDDVDYSSIRKELQNQISAFSIPIAVADEYFEELEGEYSGINLLPKYIIEQQKAFQFGWHGYAMLPILFFTAFYLTFQILSNQSKIRKLNSDIAVYNLQKSENMQLLSEIESYNLKINTFDQTQAILDDVSKGAGIWNSQFQEISDYVGTIRNLWLRNFGIQENKVKIEGHSLNKNLLTKFAAQLDSGVIKNLVYEPINKKDVYRFIINSSLPDSSSSATKTTSK